MNPSITRRTALKNISALAIGALAAPDAFLGQAVLADDHQSTAPWLGLHVMATNDHALNELETQLPALAGIGLNSLVLEVDYSFEFKSRPALGGDNFITRKKAKSFAAACRRQSVRVIPQLNCLGHQSWKSHTAALLTEFPQFDETPGKYPQNKDIYCRSWCPLHPDVNGVVFALMDDLIDGFEADAFHVGMDEIMIIGSEFCPRCNGKNTADLLAKAVNDYHGHLVDERKVTMLMWGDRLLDGKATGYGAWEASENGTSAAIDKFPTDIILCDWHYEKRDNYPSIPLFIEKGFRVWPSSWKNRAATDALVDCELKNRTNKSKKGGKVIGHLCTTWGSVEIPKLSTWEPVRAAMKRWTGQ